MTEKVLETDIKLTCPSCNSRNVIKLSKIDSKPKCGRCKTELNTESIENLSSKNISATIDKFQEIFNHSLGFYIKRYSGEDDFWEYSKRMYKLQEKKAKLEKSELPITLVVVGEFSSGKSSVINSLIGENLIPTGTEPMTLAPSIFKYAEETRIMIEFNNGNLKDITKEEFSQIKHTNKDKISGEYKDIKFIHFYYPYSKLSQINIVDTPGFNTATAQGDDKKTMEIIHDLADVILWIFNANHGTAKDSEKGILNKIKNFFNKESTYSMDNDLNFLEEAIQKSQIPIIGLLNQVDIKGEPDSSEVIKIIEEIKKETSLPLVIPYSAEEILKQRNNNLNNKIMAIINNEIILKNNNQVEINVKSDKFGNKKIIINNSEKNIFDENFDDPGIWLNQLSQLEFELDSLRQKAKDILNISIFQEINNLSKEFNKKIDKFIGININRHSKEIIVFNKAIEELGQIKSNLNKKYENFENNFKYNLSKILPDLIFDIDLDKGWIWDAKKFKMRYIDNETYMKILSKVRECFDYNNISDEEINNLSSVFDNIINNLVFDEEYNNIIKDIFDSYKRSYEQIVGFPFLYIYLSTTNLALLSAIGVAENMVAKYKNFEFDVNKTNSYLYNLLFEELYTYTHIGTIFYWLNTLVNNCYDDAIENIEFIKKLSSENSQEKDELSEIRKSLRSVIG